MHDREAVQLRLGEAIEADILPHYRKPFPRTVRARDATGRYRRLSDPFYGVADGKALDYAGYRERLLSGAIAPRTIHGPMHAARTALWAGLLSVMFDPRGSDPTGDVFALQAAAAFHDAGRQDEGVDRWEAESRRLFLRSGFPQGRTRKPRARRLSLARPAH